MARKSKGNGKVRDLTTEILISIRDEIRSTNARLDQTNARLDQTNARLEVGLARLDARIDQLRSETALGLKQVHDSLSMRLDKLIENTGEHWRDLDNRVSKVERDVDALKRD